MIAVRRCELMNNFADVCPLVMLAGPQHRIGDWQWRRALVDDPGKRADAGPHQVLLQPGRFMHRRRFGQRDQQDLREVRVAQAG